VISSYVSDGIASRISLIMMGMSSSSGITTPVLQLPSLAGYGMSGSRSSRMGLVVNRTLVPPELRLKLRSSSFGTAHMSRSFCVMNGASSTGYSDPESL